MDWGEISLPATRRTGRRGREHRVYACLSGVTCCSLPNKAADDVTEPVKTRLTTRLLAKKLETIACVGGAGQPSVVNIPE